MRKMSRNYTGQKKLDLKWKNMNLYKEYFESLQYL